MANPEHDDELLFSSGTFEHSVRELLRLSQTDQTESDKLGFYYAQEAYARAREPDYRDCDPTAAGEAAAKAALRAERLKQPLSEVDDWLQRSFSEHSRSGRPSAREFVATNILAGRIIVSQCLTGRKANTAALSRARGQFMSAETTLQQLRERDDPGDAWSNDDPDGPWDKYATMLSRHWAVAEITLPGGSAALSRALAVRGIGRALRAEREVESRKSHRTFIRKQVVANALVGAVASTQKLANVPGVRALHGKAIKKLTS